jgi:glutamate:GABA antiporter
VAASSEPSTSLPTFVRALRLRDVVLLNLVAIVSLRWIARGARAGAPSILLWLLAALAFFVPLTLAVSALSKRFPEQGGIYAWTHRAFGPRHGLLCGWCLWVNNLFYFPSLLLFAAANAYVALPRGFTAHIDAAAFSIGFVLVALWLTVGLNIVGLSRAKWLQNAGSLGLLPVVLLIVTGFVVLARFGSATSFAPGELVPHGDALASIGLWSAMCFAFSGFEIGAMMAREVHDPERTIPRGVAIAGALTVAIYLLGSCAILVAIPAGALNERSGIVDAIAIAGARVGFPNLAPAIGWLLALGALAGNSSWFAGAARVPFAAGVDRVLPRGFGALHPRYRTPHVALIVQGVVATIVFLWSVFVSVSGQRATIQEAYDVLVNVTILVYFLPYLYLFACVPKLSERRTPAIWSAALVGFAATAISMALCFVPPPGTTNVASYEANLVLETLAVVIVGIVLGVASRRKLRERGSV